MYIQMLFIQRDKLALRREDLAHYVVFFSFSFVEMC